MRPPGFLLALLPSLGWLLRHGVGPRYMRELTVRGRKSGEPRKAIVNLLEIDGHRYLVAPRGETHWVRNLRAAGEGELANRGASFRFSARELPDAAKPPLIREYLRRWSAQVPGQFEVKADADDAALAHEATYHPVFELTPR
jgi:deazaflavin-dependent oxidoreductase (nitroreductase family)